MITAEQDVRTTARAWPEAVKGLVFQEARQLWDADFKGLIYQSEEHEVPMTEWTVIEQYWDNVPALIEQVREWDEIAGEIAVVDRVALVFSRLRTSIKIRDVEQTFDGEVRLSMGLRHTEAGWRLVHYHESRPVAVQDVVRELTA
jgi:hypothetical protein